MVSQSHHVRDFCVLSPVFIYEKSSLFKALETMRTFRVESIPVINQDFSILGTVCKKEIIKKINSSIKELKSIQVSELINQNKSALVLYPRIPIDEAYSIMKCLDVKGLPVADFPWEKKFIGYIWMDDISCLIENFSLKISV